MCRFSSALEVIQMSIWLFALKKYPHSIYAVCRLGMILEVPNHRLTNGATRIGIMPNPLKSLIWKDAICSFCTTDSPHCLWSSVVQHGSWANRQSPNMPICLGERHGRKLNGDLQPHTWGAPSVRRPSFCLASFEFDCQWPKANGQTS